MVIISGGCGRYTFTFILNTYTFKLVKVTIASEKIMLDPLLISLP